MSARLSIAFLLSCALVGGAGGWLHARPVSRLTFLSVGQGDCAVWQEGGSAVLIDAGPAGMREDAGASIIVPRLRSLGVGSVDLILLSHPDLDHVEGVPSILKAYPTATVGVSAAFAEDQRFLARLREDHIAPERMLWLPPECSVQVGASTLRLTCPPVHASDNEGSMFVLLTEEKASAVFSGDAPEMTEDALIPGHQWRAQILKAGHHGSRTSTGYPWLKAVGPNYAILSCGRNNHYGHPHRQTLDRLQTAGVKVWRTDTSGDLSFDVTSEGFQPTSRF